MNVLEHEDNEKSERWVKLESAIEKAKDACGRLESKTAAAAKAVDKAIRTHPYQAIGTCFGVGLLIGALAMWNRRD